ncbi:multidrug RND transporter [Legionella norrlandica]|uniref:Multidrug RND transporter n=1 Tax=Legionella norrlandica TaxID=1498499 RepID=A0A0A2SXU8_9GAMM|nr:efflux RND transporter periplasmic adaptor subunit [Legionella norrlandica]KGP64269.1 multidrug RND transporter [Legionella norrlandica]
MNSQDKKNLIKIIAIVFFGVIFIYLVFEYFSKNKVPVSTPPVVIVQKPKLMEMAEYVTQTGNTVAFQSVDLVARIEGYLDAIKFTDGAFVKKNQELFVIEPEPYMEQLLAAQATVAAQKANYTYAKSEYARQQRMYKQNATSLNNVEKWKAQVDEAQAGVDKSEADAKNAEITYSYTHVLAPFDGRMGRHLVDVGNLVGNGKATDLATIEQIDPIYVYFNLNELDLLKIRNAARNKGYKPMELVKVPVEVALQNEEGFPHKGTLDFVNTGLNASTGTMEFRALLPNKGYPLVPGLFVEVRVPISDPSPRLTIPDSSVQYDQIGPYLLVVDKDNYVLIKRVTLGGVENGMRAITKGLDAQDRVIVSGLQNATPNDLVTPKMEKSG